MACKEFEIPLLPGWHSSCPYIPDIEHYTNAPFYWTQDLAQFTYESPTGDNWVLDVGGNEETEPENRVFVIMLVLNGDWEKPVFGLTCRKNEDALEAIEWLMSRVSDTEDNQVIGVCPHPKEKRDGSHRVPLVYGSAPGELCGECGRERTMPPYGTTPGDWHFPYPDFEE